MPKKRKRNVKRSKRIKKTKTRICPPKFGKDEMKKSVFLVSLSEAPKNK